MDHEFWLKECQDVGKKIYTEIEEGAVKPFDYNDFIK